MVTVTMAIAAIPIHVATLAGWIPEDDEDVDDDYNYDDVDDVDDHIILSDCKYITYCTI